jgi:hypothetical protein
MVEIAIPLIGLGALYVISNKNKEKSETSENFTNMNVSGHGPYANQYLPNTHVPNKNYPVQNQPIDSNSKNYIKQYLNPNQTTDKFFDNNTALTNIRANNVNKEFNSLTGNKVEIDRFQHNNMVPFFGSTIKGAQVDSNHHSILDNHQGSGSQNIKKVEQAPLFKPADNVQLTHGAPNITSFVQSRQLPSTKMANVLPWEQQKVGPGLGLGYTTEGADGFNSGMMDRKAWQPPTVDELRAQTNPKVTYGLFGHEGPAGTKIQNLPIQGKVEKNRPDTVHALGPEHWLTTTGSTLAQAQIPQQMISDTDHCTTEYYGPGGVASDSKASYMKSHHEAPHRQELCGPHLNPVGAAGQGAANDNDYGAKGYKIPKNNRQVSCESHNNGIVGGINSTFKAMMAPIVDALRPTRKEDVINNANALGNVQAMVPSLPLTNPGEKLRTTNKEMTSDKIGLNYLNVSNVTSAEGGYQVTQPLIKDQQRNSCNSSSLGFVGNTAMGSSQMDVTAWNMQHNNVNKTYQNWPMPGGTSIFNPNANIEITKKDKNRVNNRLQCNDFILPPPDMDVGIPSAETYGKIHMPQQYDQSVNAERMNPDILSAFKSNPYAQSLNSY